MPSAPQRNALHLIPSDATDEANDEYDGNDYVHIYVSRRDWLILVIASLFIGTIAAACGPVNIYDLSNRIECHNFTDIIGYPLIYVADDVVIQPENTLNIACGISNDCSGIYFTFATIRTKQDQDPTSITIRLFYNDTSNNNIPSKPPFFQRSFRAPNTGESYPRNPFHLMVLRTTTLVINNGDMSDDGTTSFDLSNPLLIPVGQTLWAAMYVTVSDHYANNLLKENSLSRMTCPAGL